MQAKWVKKVSQKRSGQGGMFRDAYWEYNGFRTRPPKRVLEGRVMPGTLYSIVGDKYKIDLVTGKVEFVE